MQRFLKFGLCAEWAFAVDSARAQLSNSCCGIHWCPCTRLIFRDFLDGMGRGFSDFSTGNGT